MTVPGIGDARRSGAEKGLQLVGAQRLERWNPRNQHGRDGDHPAAAGDRIDEAGKECGRKKKEQYVEG